MNSETFYTTDAHNRHTLPTRNTTNNNNNNNKNKTVVVANVVLSYHRRLTIRYLDLSPGTAKAGVSKLGLVDFSIIGQPHKPFTLLYSQSHAAGSRRTLSVLSQTIARRKSQQRNGQQTSNWSDRRGLLQASTSQRKQSPLWFLAVNFLTEIVRVLEFSTARSLSYISPARHEIHTIFHNRKRHAPLVRRTYYIYDTLIYFLCPATDSFLVYLRLLLYYVYIT